MANNPNAAKNLKPCKKGETHNPNGRPKNRFKVIKKEFGLSSDDFQTLIIYLLNLTPDELKKFRTDKEQPTLLIALANALNMDMKTSSLRTIEPLLDRLLGKSKQTIDNTVTLTNPPTFKVVFEDKDITINDTGNQTTTEVSTPSKSEEKI